MSELRPVVKQEYQQTVQVCVYIVLFSDIFFITNSVSLAKAVTVKINDYSNDSSPSLFIAILQEDNEYSSVTAIIFYNIGITLVMNGVIENDTVYY